MCYRNKLRVFYICCSKAVLHFTENVSLQSNEDVPSSEYIVNEADTKARRFQEPIDDVGSTISGLDVMIIDTQTFVTSLKIEFRIPN